MYTTLNEFEILNIVDRAVEYGVNALNGQKNTMALQIARFWLDGYIDGCDGIIANDIESLRTTMNNYYFN